MQKDYFSDNNKRFFKVAHLRHSKQVNAIKSGAKDKKFQNETYLQNLREITIAKYKIDIKKIEQADKCAPPDELYQKQDSKDTLEVWALRKHISKSYIQRKRQAEANYSKSINQLCNQSFNLLLSQKHQRKLAEHIVQQCDQKDQDFLQPKYTEPMAPLTDSKRSYWNVNQYKYSLPEPKTNKDHYFLTSVRNDSQASRTICYSNLGSNAKKVIRHKTEPDQKKKISEDSLTYLTAYSRNKYNLAVNSLVLKMKNNISTQRRMRNKTLER